MRSFAIRPFPKPYGGRRIGGRWSRSSMNARPAADGIGSPRATRSQHVSIHVPRGRGPFRTHPGGAPGNDAFHRAAIEALTNCPPYAARWKDRSVGGVFMLLDLYDGLATRISPSAVSAKTLQSGHSEFIPLGRSV
ncbi:MAG: hypothetical protein JWP25_8328 [Bradyrhizobium sp.]|nr:hypothetical protein [Bradyrhizobium sp.]